jgi:hypothetical protein
MLADPRTGYMNFPNNVLNWLRRHFIDEVPESDALCEFDCRKGYCMDGDWDTCQRRQNRAEGELMPSPKAGGPIKH